MAFVIWDSSLTVKGITLILQAVQQGDPTAAEELIPLVYDELRRLAAWRLANEVPGQTLQATALVHEAYLRLVGQQDTRWQGRGHFFGAAAEAMRRILVENARRKKRLKHETSRQKVHPAPAFTLVELLVVIAIIGILAALLLTVLDRSKQQAQGTYCVNNLKQMQTAWALYADDSAQVLAPNVGDLQPEWVSNLCWVVGDVSSLPDETNTLLLSDSLLGPYAKNVSIYKCPADPGNPSGTPRVRSVAMNNYMHGKGAGLSDDFVQNTRTSDIRQPASSFVFLDERSSTINDGYFVVQLTRLGGFEGVERRKCLKINARVF